MKRIDTVIKPSLWQETRAIFEALGVRATLREVQTFGRVPPRREVYRGSAYFVDLSAELELTALVEDDRVENAVLALEGIGPSAEILVSSVESVRFGSSGGVTRAP